MELQKNRTFPLLLLCAAALIFRLGFILWYHSPLQGDEKAFHSIATSLVEHGTFAEEGRITAYRAPGYPFFLAAVFSIVRNDGITVRILQAFIDTVSTLLIVVIGRRLLSPYTALLAGALYAAFPGTIIYVPMLLSETLFTFLLLITIWRSFVLLDKRTMSEAVITGAAAAACIAVRQNGLVILLAAAGALFLHRTEWKRSLLLAGIMISAVVLLLSPWMIRNLEVFGTPQLTSNGGVNLWIGHHPGASGAFQSEGVDSLAPATEEFRRSAEGTRRAIEFMLHHPWEEVRLFAAKSALMVLPDFGAIRSLLYRTEWETLPARKVYRQFSPWAVLLIHGTTLAVMILAAGYLTSVHRWHRDELFLLLIVGMWMAVHLAFFGEARFRMPVMPLLMMFAAAGIRMVNEEKAEERSLVQQCVLYGIAGGIIAANLAMLIAVMAK